MEKLIVFHQNPDMQIQPVADGSVIYQPQRERIHFLNQTATVVLALCDGTIGFHEIESLVAEAYGMENCPGSLTGPILERFLQEGMIQIKTLSRRLEEQTHQTVMHETCGHLQIMSVGGKEITDERQSR